MRARLRRLMELVNELELLADRKRRASAFQVAEAAVIAQRKREHEQRMGEFYPGWKWGDPDPGSEGWPAFAKARGYPDPYNGDRPDMDTSNSDQGDLDN